MTSGSATPSAAIQPPKGILTPARAPPIVTPLNRQKEKGSLAGARRFVISCKPWEDLRNQFDRCGRRSPVERTVDHRGGFGNRAIAVLDQLQQRVELTLFGG